MGLKELFLRGGFGLINLMLAILLLAAPPVAVAQQGGQSSLELKIVGSKKLTENINNQWSAQLMRRYLSEGADGYRPTGMASPGGGNPLPTEWEQPVSFYWDFGDGTGVMQTGERPTAGHIYDNDGSYTLTVEARNADGDSVSGTLELTVKNRSPRLSLLSAIEVDPSTATFELSTRVQDAPGDLQEGVNVHWNFGDGEEVDGDNLFSVRHAYPIAASYPVTITATDKQGEVREKSFNVISRGGGESSQNQVNPVDDEATEGELITHFEAELSGSLNTSFSGEMRSAVGLHLSPINQGSKCRFLFTAWDAAHLASVYFIADLPGLPDAEGATYTFSPPRVDLAFQPDRKSYEFARKGLLKAYTGATLSDRLKPMTEGLSEQERDMLTRLSGLDTTERESREYPAAPEVSPFGIEDQESLRALGGTVELTFIPYNRAIGKMNLAFTNHDPESPLLEINLTGDFALDLENARRDGIMLYEQCKPAEFAIKDTYPADGREHLHLRQQFISVDFTEPYDPDTMNESTFQLTYPAAGSGEPVPVAAQLLRKGRNAYLAPKNDLLGGVRYTARVKTGPEGVRGLSGVPLEDNDGSGWYRWDMTTRVNVVPEAGANQNLSCHVLQTVRDAPLIVGKPAVSRIYANWQAHPEVDPDAQVREFTARVLLRTVVDGQYVDLGSDFHRFVRPDLWPSYGIDEAKAEHTANVFWTPERTTAGSILVALEVPQTPGEDHAEGYWTQCATPLWDLEPELTVEYYALAINDWKDVDLLESYLPVLEDIMVETELYAEQSFPFKRVHKRFGGILRHPNVLASCPDPCPQNLLAQYSSQSTADIVIALMPTSEGNAGGATHSNVGNPDGAALITLTIDEAPENRDRWVFAVVHEFGHALWLDHLPYVPNEGGEEARDILTSMRDSAWANNGEPIHWHEGIEGYRIARNGQSGFNKSSVEGNEEGNWMTALMFPITIPYREAFIARHQYLSIQEKLDTLGANSTGN